MRDARDTRTLRTHSDAHEQCVTPWDVAPVGSGQQNEEGPGPARPNPSPRHHPYRSHRRGVTVVHHRMPIAPLQTPQPLAGERP